MLIIEDELLDDTPSQPFKRGGTPRGAFHGRLVDLVRDAVRDPSWSLTQDRWQRVALFDTGRPAGCFDFMDILATNERHALRSDGDVVRITDDQQDWLGANDLLADILDEIPADRELHELDAVDFESTFGSRSAFNRLLNHFAREGIDSIAAVVLLARVRPRLVPVDDRLIASILGLRIDEDPLRYWWWALHHDAELVAALQSLAAVSEHLAGRSMLRVAEALVMSSAAPSIVDAGR